MDFRVQIASQVVKAAKDEILLYHTLQTIKSKISKIKEIRSWRSRYLEAVILLVSLRSFTGEWGICSFAFGYVRFKGREE